MHMEDAQTHKLTHSRPHTYAQTLDVVVGMSACQRQETRCGVQNYQSNIQVIVYKFVGVKPRNHLSHLIKVGVSVNHSHISARSKFRFEI